MRKEAPVWTSPPTDALARVDQCIEEAHESLTQLSDALLYLYGCTPSDELPGGRLSPETELVLLAEQRRCQLATALIKRLEARVRPHLSRLRQTQVVGVEPAELLVL
jgi:hypothetical protein